MQKKQFRGYNCDLSDLQKSVELYFVGRGFRVTNFHMRSLYLTQAFKNGLGSKRLNIQISGTPADFDVTMGLGERIDSIKNHKPSFEDISLSDRTLMGELRLESNFWNYLTTRAELRRNCVGMAKTSIPPSPTIYKERETIREIEVIYCRYCGTKNNARLTSCTHCGARLY
jgi:hypothetical protein